MTDVSWRRGGGRLARRLATAATVLLVVAASAVPAASAKGPKARSCPNEKSTNNSTVTNLKAKGVGCKKAEKVAEPSGSHTSAGGLVPEAHYKSNGFKCTGSSPGPTGKTWLWSCKHKKQTVTFETNF